MNKELENFNQLEIISAFTTTCCELEGEVYWRYGEDDWHWVCGENHYDVESPEYLESKYQEALRKRRLACLSGWEM